MTEKWRTCLLIFALPVLSGHILLIYCSRHEVVDATRSGRLCSAVMVIS
jgi:hypothetical protein